MCLRSARLMRGWFSKRMIGSTCRTPWSRRHDRRRELREYLDQDLRKRKAGHGADGAVAQLLEEHHPAEAAENPDLLDTARIWAIFIGAGSSSSFRNASRGEAAASVAINSTLMVMPPTAGGKSWTTTGMSMASATAR